ncbi:hypothetical protein Patl1_22544 [Pistacia atlantica]|uniref:Uncharacterized protein n=1 Tax=Pistacia atlantica TaxID=434234 RepID=A0ACC1A2T7_9ROSI|nr:hypothetical protein Patl1_22544 [Pistacia atlantica]
MSGNGDQVIVKLIEMGFENSAVVEAVGPLFDEAIEYVLNGSNRNCNGVSNTSSSSHCFNGNGKTQGKRGLGQSSILDHFQSRQERSKSDVVSDGLMEVESLPVLSKQEAKIGSDWEVKVNSLLQKQFGYSSLKKFQKEALAAWLDHQDCLVLAATGLREISMHPDSSFVNGESSVEQKAMRGMYNIINVCPETVLRLIKPLQRLAENRGIALFAIDEVHCVSKWGHDFRPDYRQLSVLQENFSSNRLKFLKSDIPLMALTATATIQVQKDILKSLCMSEETKIVLTSLFRSNLRFSVKHSRTSSPASYQKDFCQLIDIYVRKGKTGEMKKTIILAELDDQSDSSSSCSTSGADRISPINSLEDGDIDADNDEITSTREKEMSVEYLENDVDIFQSVDNWDVACGEFDGHSPPEVGIHVVVATIAFGMGIDKLNVRRIIHYSWPQSLEAYYQEAGRAGRDGKLAECTLYANLLRAPTLLLSQRSEDQTKQAYNMLSDCFRIHVDLQIWNEYSCCRAKIPVEYCGEDFGHDKCLMCDVCVNGPPVMQNLKEEANSMMQVIAAYSVWKNSVDGSCDDVRRQKFMEKPNLGDSQKFLAPDLLWWPGLARILENKGYIREGDEKIHVQIKFPEPTELGLEFLQSDNEQTFYVYPESNMLLSESKCKSYSSFSEWGKGLG